ncbi:MAG: xanthine dehydrogenase family protein subunit M [Alphaproteobacteria bacterium]|nr:xanthine dehydrogenase family protein subunit M [Alphaproteobacteria bacterium]
MIPYAFKYQRAKSLSEAEQLLSQAPDAKLLAGGQTLIAAMKLRLANPAALIDISGLKELAFIRVDNDKVVVGAGTTHNAVATSAEIARAIPALSALAAVIGDPAVRHVGTIGGSVANNDPAADYPAAVVGLGASILTNRRSIDADSFFTGMFSTALEDNEIVKEIAFPVPERAAYEKFRNPASRYALVGVFVAETKSGVRVAVTGAAPSVFRVPAMEKALAASFSQEAIASIGVEAGNLNSDIHGSAEYRAHLVSVLAKRAIASARK